MAEPTPPARDRAPAGQTAARDELAGRYLELLHAQFGDTSPLPVAYGAELSALAVRLANVAVDALLARPEVLRSLAVAAAAVPDTGQDLLAGYVGDDSDPELSHDMAVAMDAEAPDTGQAREPVPLRFTWTELLLDELSAHGIPLRMLAKPLGLTVPEVEDLIAGERELTGDLAARIGQFLGTSARLWLNLAAQGPSLASVQAPDVAALRSALRRVADVLDAADQEFDYVTAEIDTHTVRMALLDTEDAPPAELRRQIRALLAAPTEEADRG